jgi:hypothetical protein
MWLSQVGVRNKNLMECKDAVNFFQGVRRGANQITMKHNLASVTRKESTPRDNKTTLYVALTPHSVGIEVSD